MRRHFGLDRLYRLCEVVRELVDELNIGRVIARPFVGEIPHGFERTGNRRDYSVPPPEPTLLDRAKTAERQVFAIGKIADIFAHQGITITRKATATKLSSMPRWPRSTRQATATWSFRTSWTSTCSTAIGETCRVTPRRSRPSTGACPRSGASSDAAMSSSSPPTTAAIRPGAAATIRESACRCSHSARTSAARHRHPLHLRRYRRERRSASRPAGRQMRRELPLTPAVPKAELHCHIEGAASTGWSVRRPENTVPTFPPSGREHFAWSDFTSFLRAYDAACSALPHAGGLCASCRELSQDIPRCRWRHLQRNFRFVRIMRWGGTGASEYLAGLGGGHRARAQAARESNAG